MPILTHVFWNNKTARFFRYWLALFFAYPKFYEFNFWNLDKKWIFWTFLFLIDLLNFLDYFVPDFFVIFFSFQVVLWIFWIGVLLIRSRILDFLNFWLLFWIYDFCFLNQLSELVSFYFQLEFWIFGLFHFLFLVVFFLNFLLFFVFDGLCEFVVVFEIFWLFVFEFLTFLNWFLFFFECFFLFFWFSAVYHFSKKLIVCEFQSWVFAGFSEFSELSGLFSVI